MATHSTEDFLAQAAHNFALAKHLRREKSGFLDWAVVCLFYSAIHYVHAYLAKTGQTIPTRHRNVVPAGGIQSRHDVMQRDPTLKLVYASYRHLDDESRDARYELVKISVGDYDSFLLPKYESLKKCLVAKIVN